MMVPAGVGVPVGLPASIAMGVVMAVVVRVAVPGMHVPMMIQIACARRSFHAVLYPTGAATVPAYPAGSVRGRGAVGRHGTWSYDRYATSRWGVSSRTHPWWRESSAASSTPVVSSVRSTG